MFAKQYQSLAIGIGALVLLAVLAEIVYRFVGDFWVDGKPDAQKITAPGSPSQQQSVNVQQVIAAHLFGHARTTVVPTREAPKTRLQLKLLGVMASPDERYARALIAVGSEAGEAYRVGEQIANTDAKLHEINRNLVLLDREGRLERLELIRESIIDEPAGEDQDPSTLPTPSPNDIELFEAEDEIREQQLDALEQADSEREEPPEQGDGPGEGDEGAGAGANQ